MDLKVPICAKWSFLRPEEYYKHAILSFKNLVENMSPFSYYNEGFVRTISSNLRCKISVDLRRLTFIIPRTLSRMCQITYKWWKKDGEENLKFTTVVHSSIVNFFRKRNGSKNWKRLRLRWQNQCGFKVTWW